MKSNNKASSEVKFDIKDFLKRKKAERDAKIAGSGLNFENSCKNSHKLQQNSSNDATGSSSKGHFWQNQHVVSWSRGDR